MIDKTLFIFGAGASKADEAPVQNELLSEIFDLLEGNNEYKCANLNQEFVKEIKDFLFKLYPISEKLEFNEFYPTFEEIMGLIHFAIIRDESFKGISFNKLKTYIEALIALISYILETKLGYKAKVNRKFIKYLYEKFKDKNPINNVELNKIFINTFSFLNINYDILLDNALNDLKEEKGVQYEYCFKVKSRFYKLKLFKPHGSLNWLLCKSCGKVKTGDYNKIALRYYHSILYRTENNEYCSCGSDLSPLIIPPSFFKELKNPIIQNILINLENHLIKVKNLIFIGYSFPEADIHLKYLFKKAQLKGGFEKIILINKEGVNNSYFRNVIMTFPEVELINLTTDIPNGLEEESIDKIIKILFEELKHKSSESPLN
ncbi:MAG: hypothetical protein EU532_13215 [Promethearchaeota archaeon]|nr:MAG: hypothetical protein EU532_13215 [Candidatus Lokiarchaeota archaeon]